MDTLDDNENEVVTKGGDYLAPLWSAMEGKGCTASMVTHTGGIQGVHLIRTIQVIRGIRVPSIARCCLSALMT